MKKSVAAATLFCLVEEIIMRKNTLKVYAWTLGLGFIYFVWVRFFDGGIPCFYLLTTGNECGSCGISRMMLSIISLDFKSAFFYNPVLFVAFWVWNAVGLGCILEKPKFLLKPAFFYTLLALTVLGIILLGLWRSLY